MIFGTAKSQRAPSGGPAGDRQRTRQDHQLLPPGGGQGVVHRQGQPAGCESQQEAEDHYGRGREAMGQLTRRRRQLLHHHLERQVQAVRERVDRAEQAEIVMSVSAGAALLAKAGVLDGHRATTNARGADWVAEQGPRVTWVREARWVDDGKVITSAGVASGLDMVIWLMTIGSALIVLVAAGASLFFLFAYVNVHRQMQRLNVPADGLQTAPPATVPKVGAPSP